MKMQIFLAVLAVVAAADARSLTLDESHVSNGTVTDGNATYRVLFLGADDVSNARSRIYVVENLSAIAELSNSIDAAGLESSRIDREILQLHNLSTGMQQLKMERELALETLVTQKHYYEATLSNLTGQKAALEGSREDLQSMMTGNVVLSPGVYQAGVVLLIVLIASAAVLQGRDYLMTKEERAAQAKGEMVA
ncbi:MAG: hypothetical protein HYY37_00445 [Candidatus Aenigmarchaeota archaeon]|nr:hypothetical protein [Candidatus Aenigmarchaeota archaeon]